MMSFIQIIKNTFNKVDFDDGRPDISVYNYHPQFRVMLASVGIFFVNRNSVLRWIMPIINTTLAITGICMAIMTIWHGISVKNYGFATESFSYAVIWGTEPWLYISIMKNTNIVLKMVEDMNNNFIEICALGPRYRVPFMKTQLMIWKLCFAWAIILVVLLQGYIIIPVLFLTYQSLFAPQDVDLVRPLPLPVWLPGVDVFQTPQYEILFILHVCTSISCVQTFIVYISVWLHIFLHYYGLMNMIILDFEVLFDGLDESMVHLPWKDPRRMRTQITLSGRMKRIVLWHKAILKLIYIAPATDFKRSQCRRQGLTSAVYMKALTRFKNESNILPSNLNPVAGSMVLDAVSLVFGPPLVYQLAFSPFALCLMGYQIADKLDHGQFDILFVILFMCTLCQIGIPCYLGTILRDKAFAVGDACWNCGWEATSLSRMLRLDIVTFILRCQIPVTIKFIGLPNVDLETYSSIVTTAYSYFNMLRQYSKK